MSNAREAHYITTTGDSIEIIWPDDTISREDFHVTVLDSGPAGGGGAIENEPKQQETFIEFNDVLLNRTIFEMKLSKQDENTTYHHRGCRMENRFQWWSDSVEQA